MSSVRTERKEYSRVFKRRKEKESKERGGSGRGKRSITLSISIEEGRDSQIYLGGERGKQGC